LHGRANAHDRVDQSMQPSALLFAGPISPVTRIVELIGYAKPADAADGFHALLSGAETAVRGAAIAATTILCAPGIRIIGKWLSLRPRRRQGRGKD
jgi:hypothetical protein